jgi:integrase
VNHAQRPGRYIKKGNRNDKIDFLTPEEGHQLLESAEAQYPRFYQLLLAALRTGARQGELIGLQWGDIDWNGKFIEIRRSNWNGYISTPKNGKGRRVDMSDRLAAVLVDYRRNLAAEALENGRPMAEWVFPSLAGTALDAANVRKTFEVCLKKAGLRKIRFHDLRHSFASWLIGNGESLVYVKEQLGHHSIQITVDTYGHLIPGANRQAVNRLDDPIIDSQRSILGEPSASAGS